MRLSWEHVDGRRGAHILGVWVDNWHGVMHHGVQSVLLGLGHEGRSLRDGAKHGLSVGVGCLGLGCRCVLGEGQALIGAELAREGQNSLALVAFKSMQGDIDKVAE